MSSQIEPADLAVNILRAPSFEFVISQNGLQLHRDRGPKDAGGDAETASSMRKVSKEAKFESY